jgi:hypothetical protein
MFSNLNKNMALENVSKPFKSVEYEQFRTDDGFSYRRKRKADELPPMQPKRALLKQNNENQPTNIPSQAAEHLDAPKLDLVRPEPPLRRKPQHASTRRKKVPRYDKPEILLTKDYKEFPGETRVIYVLEDILNEISKHIDATYIDHPAFKAIYLTLSNSIQSQTVIQLNSHTENLKKKQQEEVLIHDEQNKKQDSERSMWENLNCELCQNSSNILNNRSSHLLSSNLTKVEKVYSDLDNFTSNFSIKTIELRREKFSFPLEDEISAIPTTLKKGIHENILSTTSVARRYIETRKKVEKRKRKQAIQHFECYLPIFFASPKELIRNFLTC